MLLKICLIAAVAALAALAVAASAATAASLGLEPSRIRTISRGLLTFAGAFGIEARCNMTLGGTLHRGLINKVERALLGFITEVQQPSCSQSSLTFLVETLPWHIRYISIAGALPERVTSMTIELSGFSFGASGCLVARGSPRFNAVTTGLGGSRYSSGAMTSNRTALATNCFGLTGAWTGTFNFTPTITITRN